MTCIVGIEKNGKVYLGGDIQGTGGNNKIVHTQPKVFNKAGVIFGYTTSYRFGQIIEHLMQDPVVPEDNESIYRWIITTLAPSIKSTLKDNGYERGGTCLIGVKDQLWEFQDDYSILRSVSGIASCGSGCEYAMGSMLTSVATGNQTPKQMIKQAINIAGTLSPSVGTDCVVIHT